jgi:3-dehydroquinate synthase
MSDVTQIDVSGGGNYSVFVGRDLLSDGAPLIRDSLVGASKVLIVHPPTLVDLAKILRDELSESFQVILAEVPDAEAGKRVEVAAFCWQVLGSSDFTRTDAIIGLGGGAVTDLAGFVAATWLRGVRFVNVPTTVLGMVDASVGGKTGINTNEGKNLVGAFYAPVAVVCDLATLDTLPVNEKLAGFAEVVKCGFIADPEILDIIEADVAKATDSRTEQFRTLIEKAIGIKARVVSEDFTEQGQREILNYGHTLGHAIEHAERYQWRHGAAISVGMVFAAELSALTSSLPAEDVDRHRRVLSLLGLPTTYSAGRWDTLLATMRRDKKARGSMLRFITLSGIGKPVTVNVPDTSVLFAAFQETATHESID